MAKIVQMVGTMVYFVLPEKTIEEAREHYNFEQLKNTSGIEIVECQNDNVKQQWQLVNGEFVPPTPPVGWGYDIDTGVFFEKNAPAQYDVGDDDKIEMAKFIVSI